MLNIPSSFCSVKSHICIVVEFETHRMRCNDYENGILVILTGFLPRFKTCFTSNVNGSNTCNMVPSVLPAQANSPECEILRNDMPSSSTFPIVFVPQK